MTTVYNNILACTCNVRTMSVKNDVRDNISFSIEIMSTLKTIKSSLKRSYDTQNLMLVAISYEIYETRQRLIS